MICDFCRNNTSRYYVIDGIFICCSWCRNYYRISGSYNPSCYDEEEFFKYHIEEKNDSKRTERQN